MAGPEDLPGEGDLLGPFGGYDALCTNHYSPDLGRGMGKKGWIREKPALDTIQSDFLMDGYPPLENRDGFGGL